MTFKVKKERLLHLGCCEFILLVFLFFYFKAIQNISVGGCFFFKLNVH